MLNRRRIAAVFSAVVGVGLWAPLAWPAEHNSPGPAPEPKSRPACILIWLEGGPPTIDMWDLKERTSTHGTPFRPIATAGNMEICEHFPQVAQVMDKLSIIRSMSCRGEVDERAWKYMHTCHRPTPIVEHPTVGSVIARELSLERPELTLPAYFSLRGSNVGAGYLEPRFAPLVIDDVPEFRRQLDLANTENVFGRPRDLVDAIDAGFETEREWLTTQSYRDVKNQTWYLLRSSQLHAFNVDEEDPALRAAYGSNEFGHDLLVARRLVEAGVPFVEVTLPGWDVRQDYFEVLRVDLFPKLDAGVSTLVRDLDSRGLLDDTVVVVTGGFSRAPYVRHGTRDHWSSSWSLLVGGGGLKGGVVVGKTSSSGRVIESRIQSPPDLWATVGRALGISLDTVYRTRNGRPTRIFNRGRPIEELFVD